MCSKPFRKHGQEYGCGQCMPCRVNRKRLWTARLVYESCCHESSLFVTLTYADHKVPAGETLVPADMRNFLKRLRFHAEKPLRFYGVGEYGDRTLRPHYHLAIFGLSDPSLIEKSWDLGYSMVGLLSPEAAGYIVHYVTKGLTKHENISLDGRHPEFARMSRRPGIGAGLVDSIAGQLNTRAGAGSIAVSGDIPDHLKIGSQNSPLGRYLRSRIRETAGYDSKAPETKTYSNWVELHASVILGRQSVSEFVEAREQKRIADGYSTARRNQISHSKRTF